MNKLLDARKAKGLTQQEVADFLGITRPAYTNIENGKRQPDNKVLIALAGFYGVTADYLLGIQDTKKAPDVAEAEKISDPDELLGLALYNKYGTVTKEDMEDAKKVLDVFFGRRDKNENDG